MRQPRFLPRWTVKLKISLSCDVATHLQCSTTHALLQYSLSHCESKMEGLLQPSRMHGRCCSASGVAPWKERRAVKHQQNCILTRHGSFASEAGVSSREWRNRREQHRGTASRSQQMSNWQINQWMTFISNLIILLFSANTATQTSQLRANIIRSLSIFEHDMSQYCHDKYWHTFRPAINLTIGKSRWGLWYPSHLLLLCIACRQIRHRVA